MAVIALAGCVITAWILKKKGGKTTKHITNSNWWRYFSFRNFVNRWEETRKQINNLQKQIRELQDKIAILEKKLQ